MNLEVFLYGSFGIFLIVVTEYLIRNKTMEEELVLFCSLRGIIHSVERLGHCVHIEEAKR